ncbi:hypothetical protein C8J57DRAFT_1286003 [Mycena rebaudengoi]|nr:hypothetical protein C8J57DRAFT_1286003 [Mycena rebaudengoi]
MNWNSVVQWLDSKPLVEPKETPGAGYGLFALDDIPPRSPLFTVPAAALLNIRTLSPHYPTHSLSAVQLISLHLLLYRPNRGRDSLDPLFGPYISVLPRDFDSHPLVCHVKGADIRQLPPSVACALERLSARFQQDWEIVHRYLRDNLHVLSLKPGVDLARDAETIQADFLWAWLNVNTRCIYHRLKSSRSHPDNLTLCPILDFANHTVDGPCMIPRISDAEKNNAAPLSRLGDPLTLLSPGAGASRGQEMYLTYGAHSNKTLFVEYGFVTTGTCGEVDVQDLVERLFKDKGQEGNIKKEILEESGYWGSDGSDDDSLQRWRDTLTGVRDLISDANERVWKKTVSEMCLRVMERARDARAMDASNTWIPGAVGMLWDEEYRVAHKVHEFIT